MKGSMLVSLTYKNTLSIIFDTGGNTVSSLGVVIIYDRGAWRIFRGGHLFCTEI